jgi:CRP-like cAMP-binding protein
VVERQSLAQYLRRVKPCAYGAHVPSPSPSDNLLLAALTAQERARVEPLLTLVNLAHGTLLQEADEEIADVYFPVRGVASLVGLGREGEEVDTAMIGAEGMVGLPVFLGTGQMPVKAMVQIDMAAYRLSSDELRAELEHGGSLTNVLLRYAQAVLVELAQLVLCNRVHPLDQRTARWILQLNDRLPSSPPFEATQEFIASMLGTTRPHLTGVMQSFRNDGLISYQRGTLQVTDPPGLEGRACACYRTIRNELDRLLRTSERYDITAGG